MEENKNLYQITKTIRFKLEPDSENNKIKDDIRKITNQNNFNLINFVSELKIFIDDMKRYLFYKNDKNKELIKGKIVVKNKWLRLYAKQEFANLKERQRIECEKRQKNDNNNFSQTKQQNTIDDVIGLEEIIKLRFNYVNDAYKELIKDAVAELNERAKRAHTLLLLKRLYTRNAMPCLISFIENTNDKSEKENLSLKLKNQGKKVFKQLVLGIQEYLPEQSSGLTITKASFNYYTINKKSIDYNKNINDIYKKLRISLNDKWLQILIKDVKDMKENILKEILDYISKDILNRINKENPLFWGDIPIDNIGEYASLRQNLKNIKSKQKSEFQEMMQKEDFLYENLKSSNLYLFNNISKEEFKEYYEKTKKIKEKSKEKNKNKSEKEIRKIQSELQKLKKERGALINAEDKNQKNKFRRYKEFSKLYRYISQKHGYFLSQLKGIEKEKVESQLLSYWALILKENNLYKLVLIPKEKSEDCRKEILGEKNNSEHNEKSTLYWFESFTFRSLRKLCFGNIENKTGSNTFYPKISEELREKYFTTIKKGEKKFIRGEFIFKGDEQKKIQFYKDVLSSEYAKKVLNLPFDDIKNDIIEQNFDTLDDFILALEKICYCRFITTDKNIIDSLKKKYSAQIFKITSLDLQNPINTLGKETIYSHSNKTHTKIWRQFWTNDNESCKFDIRLNPEINITYRKPKQSRIDKYGITSNNYDRNKHNRYLYEQFTLITTFLEHSNTPTKDISFINDEDFKKSITNFNNKINTNDIKFAIGLDNGEVELSTLGIYLPNFDKHKNEDKIAELQKTKEFGFEFLTIKELSYKEKDVKGNDKKIIQNPSYFLNKDLYCRTFGKNENQYKNMFDEVFDKKNSLTLDLSMAKVINGQIVSNGDIISLYNLWKRHAQRNIYEMNDHINKSTDRRVIIKKSNNLYDNEKKVFVDYLYRKSKKGYNSFTEEEKNNYIKWLFSKWENNNCEENEKFEEIEKEQHPKGNYSKNCFFACCYVGEKIEEVRYVFHMREDFKFIKNEENICKEIEKYNGQTTISNEELDLKINQIKKSLVANCIGVVDWLYNKYKHTFCGDGIIVKEGFGINKVSSDQEKFSGNIYRILERKLYQKFQNYGLVPPIKNLMLFRADEIRENDFIRLGNVCFVYYGGTSQKCPVCEKGNLNHKTICPENCGFKIDEIMHSNDGIAAYNIAKRGFEELNKKNN